MKEGYTKLEDLFVYKVCVELGDLGWNIYSKLDWKYQKIIGDQFIRSVDSVAANIAEGYGRYHYLDRIKFYYIARASLLEVKHWIFTLLKRDIIIKEQFDNFIYKSELAHYQINRFIQTTYQSKKDG